jgi:hypothetical protein
MALKVRFYMIAEWLLNKLNPFLFRTAAKCLLIHFY